MSRINRYAIHALAWASIGALVGPAWAADPVAAPGQTTGQDQPKVQDPIAADQPQGYQVGGAEAGGPNAGRPKYPPFTDVLRDMKTADGLFRLYYNDTQILAELGGQHFNRDFIVLISIAKGISEGQILGGMTWGFGDDWIWQFRKVQDNVHIVRRNLRFRAAPGSPEEKAVSLAYTDSILFSLPIVTMGPTGGVVIDLTRVFMSDLPQIGSALPGFFFAPDKSTWAQVKSLEQNVELEVAATYASGGNFEIETVPDSRGVSVNVHYSISLLPQTGYQPRQADDRVGYFLTVVKDFSKRGDEDRFVRYINRWDLQKVDPSAELSPPRKPIIFWLEKTVPFQYRKPIRDGILEWNKAFEKAGFVNAVEVRQQEDRDTWDPEDINYNTFRWITAGAGFAMGPSRVNPSTGQILDADIIFDSDFVQFWKQEYETFTPQAMAELTHMPLDMQAFKRDWGKTSQLHRHSSLCQCELHNGMSQELALASIVLAAQPLGPDALKQQEKIIMQGLKEVTMHEVGHTLGLRHNFKSSTMYTLSELNDVEKTKDTGLTGSVMDYSPVNIVPKDMKQGDYYSNTIGPYDLWAIEYGYKPLGGGTDGEVGELQKIASRAADPLLSYATDEDTMGPFSPDPLSNRFDLGKDTVEYAEARARLISELIPGVVERVTANGDGYQRARQAFGVLLRNYGNAMFMAARNVGGVYVNRDHKGDPNERAPFVVVPVEKQMQALAMIEERVLSDKPFNFPPELYNHLAASRWLHWGTNTPLTPDFPVHDVINQWQQQILFLLLSSATLDRLHDAELKVPADQNVLTTADLITRVTGAVYAEVANLQPGEYTNRKPAISSLRRNLQRGYLKQLSALAMGESGAPEDCRTVAFGELSALDVRIKDKLANPDLKLDTYSRSHLQETSALIQKVLEARLNLQAP